MSELLGEPVILGACGVEVGFDSSGTDAQRRAGLFERGQPGVSCGTEFVSFALGAGPDAGGFLDSLRLGALGAANGGGLGLLGPCRLRFAPDITDALGPLRGTL